MRWNKLTMLGFASLVLAGLSHGQWYSFMLPRKDDFRAFAPYAVSDSTYLYDRETIATMGEWNSPDARATLARLIELKGIPKDKAVSFFREVVKKRGWNEFILGPGDEYYGYPGAKSSGPRGPYVGNTIVLGFGLGDDMHISEWRFMTPFEVYALHQKQIGNGPVEWKWPCSLLAAPRRTS
jgi:hypothetical protein